MLFSYLSYFILVFAVLSSNSSQQSLIFFIEIAELILQHLLVTFQSKNLLVLHTHDVFPHLEFLVTLRVEVSSLHYLLTQILISIFEFGHLLLETFLFAPQKIVCLSQNLRLRLQFVYGLILLFFVIQLLFCGLRSRNMIGFNLFYFIRLLSYQLLSKQLIFLEKSDGFYILNWVATSRFWQLLYTYSLIFCQFHHFGKKVNLIHKQSLFGTALSVVLESHQQFFPLFLLLFKHMSQLAFCQSFYLLQLSFKIVEIRLLFSVLCLQLAMSFIDMSAIERPEDFVEVGLTILTLRHSAGVELAGGRAEQRMLTHCFLMFHLFYINSSFNIIIMQTELAVKVVIIGTVGVGKSSLAIRYVHNEFNDHLDSTLGAVYLEKTIVCQGKKIKFQLWDTAGQQRYKAIARIYYKDCKVAVMVFDLSSHASFEEMKRWIDQLKSNAPEDALIALVGNKCDLEKIDVSHDEFQEYATSLGALFKYTSAKDGKGVDQLFSAIAQQLLSRRQSVRVSTSSGLKPQRRGRGSCC